MTGFSKNTIQVLVRLCKKHNLIFFLCVFTFACEPEKHGGITVHWKAGKPTGMSMPHRLLKNFEKDSVPVLFEVRLDGSETPMLGTSSSDKKTVSFDPLIPFTPGLTYNILWRHEPVGKVDIPLPDSESAPSLVAVFPSQDTVPENMLKVYLYFSQPMRVSEALKHIVLIKNHRDTVKEAFLDLQPELWNAEHTRLTLWLDPGRIKRDLKPNKMLGAPLETGQQYTLVVGSKWKDEHGVSLAKVVTKEFFTTVRDGVSPDPKRWVIHSPMGGTRDTLKINVMECLDQSLLMEAVTVKDQIGNLINGSVSLQSEERLYLFFPINRWSPGVYTLEVQARLEDLAGNNINKVFDRDILSDHKVSTKALVSVRFKIGDDPK